MRAGFRTCRSHGRRASTGKVVPKTRAFQPSISTLLLTLAIVPLLALLLMGGNLAWQSYAKFDSSDDVALAQRLAGAGARLSQALPGEALSTAGVDIPAARKVTDLLSEINSIYDQMVAAKLNNYKIDADVAFLKAKTPELAAYRQHPTPARLPSPPASRRCRSGSSRRPNPISPRATPPSRKTTGASSDQAFASRGIRLDWPFEVTM
jgi:hypothetical protein